MRVDNRQRNGADARKHGAMDASRRVVLDCQRFQAQRRFQGGAPHLWAVMNRWPARGW